MNNMFNTYSPLPCKCCGKDTLIDPAGSNVVLNKDSNGILVNIYVCCKGECDRNLGSLAGWQDLARFTNPYLYLQHINSVLNEIQKTSNTIFTNESLQNYKEIIIKTAPLVFRDMTEKEKQQAIVSDMFPF